MRRIRPATIVSSFCAAVDGGRATIAAPFSTANPKPKPHTKPPSDIFVRKQLQSEERARKALGIWSRDYGGRSTQDDDELADEEKVNIRKVSSSQEEFNAFLKNIWIECATDYKKYEIIRKQFHIVHTKMIKEDGRVDRLAEIAAEEELNTFLTNSFTAKLMIECEPKYEKRFREIIEKVRKKMIQDDEILETFALVTEFMSKCEPEYEELLCEVLEKVRDKISQDDKGEIDNTSKIEKLAELGMNEGKLCSFEEKLDEFVTDAFLTNLKSVEEKKSYFMAYEVIEKVAKKVGNENLRKIAEKELDALVTYYFLSEIVGVQTHMKSERRARRGRRAAGRPEE